MEADKYQELTGRTESIPEPGKGFYLPHPEPGYIGVPVHVMRLLHHVLGMVTEAGELADQMKRHAFYYKPLDETNLFEECGDSDWYNKRLLDTIGRLPSDCMDRNIAKLTARYPEKFTTEAATNRNLGAERKALEITPPVEVIESRESASITSRVYCACGGPVVDGVLCAECKEEHDRKMGRSRQSASV
jgi:hypothetical protein